MYGKLKIIGPYFLALIIGMALAFFSHGDETPFTKQSKITPSAPTESASNVNSSPIFAPSLLKTVPSKTGEPSLANSCNENCLTTRELLFANAIIDDENYSKLSGLAQGLAAYLEENHIARIDMLDLAKTTQDGNKRAFLIDTFILLPVEQRKELGQALTTSSDWQIRANGITLLSSHEIMTPDGAKTLMTSYANEPNTHVKSEMLKALNKPDTLRGDQTTLDYLSQVMFSETNPKVKSEAMLTKLALQEDPLTAMPDTLMALTSGQPEFQHSAFIALERIYEANDLVDGGLDRIDHEAIKRALEDLMEAEVTPENTLQMGRLLNAADMFYERHY